MKKNGSRSIDVSRDMSLHVPWLNDMGLLDFEYNPPFQPPKVKRFRKETPLSQEERDTELNNHDREIEDENYKQPDN